MTRRLVLTWPDARPFRRLGGERIRILALSDEPDPALDDPRNRDSLGEVDLVVGCGDLSPDRLAFVADAFAAPLVYVTGNHDTGEGWVAKARVLPAPLPSGVPSRHAGLLVVGLSWAHRREAAARRDEIGAWQQAAGLAFRRVLARPEPLLVISHAAPRSAGDGSKDAYHLGFAAYRWLLDRFRPPLWLHGHTPLSSGEWRVECGATSVVNVTGSVVVDLTPPGPVSMPRP